MEKKKRRKYKHVEKDPAGKVAKFQATMKQKSNAKEKELKDKKKAASVCPLMKHFNWQIIITPPH